MRMMENRFDFLFRFFPTTLTLILNVFTVSFIFSQVDEIAGWRFNELLLLMGTYYIVWGIFFGLFIHNLSRINKMVNDGDLDILLTKPIDSQFYTSFRMNIDFGEASTLITGIYLVIYSFVRMHVQTDVMNVLVYLLLITSGVIAAYSIWFMIMTLSFWTKRLPELHEAFLSLYSMNKYPLDIYRGVLKTILVFFLPIAVMVTFPTKFLLGRLTLPFMLWSLSAGIILLYTSHVFWNFALRHYSSASS